MFLELEETVNYLRVDIDKDDSQYAEEIKLIKSCMLAAEKYLENATGIVYKEKDSNGNAIDYSEEKLFLLPLVADMYERRQPTISKEAGFIWQSTILQLSLKE